jgi:Type II CAAX prenyl endopeptidase Rce1-like
VKLTPVWFDYWVLCALQLASLLTLNIRIVLSFGVGVGQTSFYFEVAVISLVYAVLATATATILPRLAGMPVMPIVESWRAGSLDVRRCLRVIIAASGAGILIACLAVYYNGRVSEELIRWGLYRSILRHPIEPAYSPLAAICTAVLEEILFRASIFPALAVGARRISQRFFSTGGLTPAWLANVLQALIFGGGHIAVGIGILKGLPWYARIPLVSQTWVALVMGCIYWRYGLESVIVCHASADLFLLGITRNIGRP